MTKLTRMAFVALVLAALLAVASFAGYTVNLDGTVNGLEDGVDYTAAKYDFAADAYGEFAELTDTTELTPGVWGIKAGDADAETVFISGQGNGEMTFWNSETNLPVYNFAGPNDNLVPGKWSVSTNGAFRTVAAYVGTNEASACLYLVKSKYLQQVEGSWLNATPIEGETNLIQESVLKYGFAANQIVPAKDVNALTNAWLTIQTGGNALNKAKGYTQADIKGTVTFIVKVPGEEGTEKYVVDIDSATVSTSIAAPAAMAESEGYLIGFEFAPYANCPDDIFLGSATDTAGECYAHYGLKKGANFIDFDKDLPAAPTGVVDGFGTFGGLEYCDYMVAPATINADGNGLEIGAWEDFDIDSRTYTGLYAIKEVYGERESDVTFAYAYGVHADRAAIGTLGGSNGNTVIVTGGQKFYPGQYSGHYTQYYTGTAWEIMSHGQVGAEVMKPSYDARIAYEALLKDETATEDDIAAAKATLDAKNAAVVKALNGVNLRYAYAPEEIIPTKLVNSFRITANQNNNYFTLTGNQPKKAVAYVADNDGNITTYEQIITQPFTQNLDFTVKFDEFLPEEGYLVAFQIYPCTNITADQLVKVTGTASFRYYTKVLPSNYSIDEPAALPTIGERPTGLTIDSDGIISGLDANKRYEYTQYDIGGMLPEVWNVTEKGATTIETDMFGLIAVRFRGDGYSTSGSDIAVVYRPGNKRDDILNLVTELDKNGNEIQTPAMKSVSWNSANPSFEEGKWTGMLVTTSLAKNYGFDPLTLGTTDCPSTTFGVKEFQNGTYDSEELMENVVSKVYYTYQYLPEEIVDMKYFQSFTYSPKLRQGAFRVNSGKVYTQFTLWVMTEAGDLEARTVYKEANMKDYAGNTQTVTLADFEKTDGYIVAIEIRPFAKLGEGTVFTIPSGQAGTAADYSVNLFKDGYKVFIDLPNTDKPTGLEYADGKVIGLDADENYKYAQFNINGIPEIDYVDVEDGATEFEIGDMVGLIAISKKGDGIYTKDSLPAYVYVPADGYDNILHTETIVADGGSNKDKEIDVPVVASVANDGTVHFNAGKWTGVLLTTGLQKTHGFDPLILGSTGVPVGTAEGLKKAEDAFAALGEDATADEIAAATAALETAREEAAARSNKQYFSYAYLPNEIIPMRDFISYKYGGPRARQTGFEIGSGNVYTKFVFKVITEDGELVDREVLKKVEFPWNNTTTINASDFTETDGYIVGIVIYPFGHIDGYYKANGAGTTSGDYNIQLYADGYKVTRTLAPAKMTKLEVENGVVSGFEAKYTYEYAAYGINGAIGEWADVEGDEFALVNTGLTAIRIKTDNAKYAASEPQVFYYAGNYSDRAAIFEYDENNALVNAKGNDFIVGTFVSPRLSYLNSSSVGASYAGANVTLDQQVGAYSNVSDSEKLWLLQHTKEEAQAILDAEVNYQSGYNQTSGHDGSYYPARLQGVIDAHYAKAHDIPAEIKAITDNLVNNYSKSYIRYALAEDEILPVGELKTLKFLNKTRQGAFEFKAQSKVNVYVMDENGVVTPYAWTSEPYAVARHTNYYHTVDVQNMIDLPETGWVVGIEFIPYAVVDGSSIVSVANARIAYKAQAWAFDQQHVVMGFYYDTYEVIKPAIDKPDYIEYADGKFTGLLADKTYAYGRFTATGVLETTEITGVTELEVPGVGVWGIQLIPDNIDEFNNSAFVVGYNKDMTDARDNIIHLVDYTKTNGTVVQVPAVATAGTFNIANPIVFNEGTWTGYSLTNSLVNYGYNNMVLGTTSCTVGGTYAKAIAEAVNDIALDAARVSAANTIAKVYYSYEYTAAEAIPMNEFISWSFESRERQGSLVVLEGSLQTKFVFKVVTEDGIIEDRVVYKNAKLDGGGSKITVNIDDFEETDGYIVGIVIYPYGNCPEGTILGSDGDTTAEDLLVILGNDYTVVPAESGKPAETPVISVTNENAVITVTNYNAAVTYAYSTDNGETWVEFVGSSFNATKANTQYVVKALESEFFGESEVSASVTSPAVTMVGRSVVLDGQIGIKIYFDVAMDLIKPDTLLYYTTKINSDYKNYPSTSPEFTALYRQGDYVTMNRAHKWMTKFQLDEETGLYYVIFYVPAKDIDNTVCETQLNVSLTDGTKITVNSMGIYPMNYIAEAKELAAAGNAEFVAALPLVEALETYLAYADNYFGAGSDAAYVSTASMEDITAPTRTNAALEGVAFYGTSLLLEDQVTIRHYFAVEDIDAFEVAYDVAGKYGTKGNFIYFDIADIPAQEIGEVQTLTIADLEGNTVYEVNYSAANYIKDMVNDEDVNLASLVNAMYDYYLAAADYTK